MRRALVPILPIIFICVTSGTGAAVSPVSAFASLKALTGTWVGTTSDGRPMTIEFKAGVNGSALVETQSPAAPDEMMTVYSVTGGELVLVHYCPMGPQGNQPHMRLDAGASSPTELRFTFTGAENLDPEQDIHVHNGRIVLAGPDSLEREWEIYRRGKLVATERFTLKRKKGTPTP
ncbi:MAG: hypothetical protein HY049_17410 [Acidobacteria bacterium]|nr:hypothetical protein [Acidobacteriota bacterium]